MAIKKSTIGIFGFGNMGQAIFRLLKADKNFANTRFVIYSLGLKKQNGAKCVSDFSSLCAQSDLIFPCVKPQDFKKLPAINIDLKNKIVISIMAGIKIERIGKIIHTSKIVRAMPNLALQIGQSMTGWHADKTYFSRAELAWVKGVMAAFGKYMYLDNEKKIDAVTAVSGSGPAYVFLFMDALMEAAMKVGFTEAEARLLVNQTVKGSLNYAESSDLPTLIKKVSSKKGTTEAALKSLKVNSFYRNWERAVKKAYERSKELSK